MLSLRQVRVVSYSIEYYDVYWEIDSTREDVQKYDFYVERSEAEAGPWEQIAGPMVDRYYLRDNSIPRLSHTRFLFYRVRVRNRVTGGEIVSRPSSHEGDPPLDAQEIIRLEQVLWREFVGVTTWLFPRRTFGQRCPQCFDPVMNKTKDDACKTCYGTGFSGGYHYPVRIDAQFDQSEHAEQVTQQFHQQAFYYSMRCGPTPFVKPLDLVINNLNERFRVISTSTTSRLGVTVHHECKLVLLARGTIEDSIPLQVDTESVVQRPPRNYSNPHNLENERDVDMSSVLRLYGFR